MDRCGVKKAVAPPPITKAEAVLPYLEQLDMVLVMTVSPASATAFLESQLDTSAGTTMIETYNPACELGGGRRHCPRPPPGW